MKIAIISKNYRPPWNEGVKNLTKELVYFLKLKKNIVNVITTRNVNENIFSFVRHIVKRINYLNPDIIFYFSSMSPVLGLKTYFIKKATRKPLILFITGKRKVIFGYHVLLKYDKILVNCNFLKQYFNDSSLIYPFIRTESKNYKNVKKENIVLFLGAFEKSRGVEYLLRAISRIKNIPNLKLLIAWNKYGKNYIKITRLVNKLQIASITKIYGSIDTSKFYSIAKLTVIPRVSEERMSFPLRIIESFSFNTPVIASNILGLPEAVGNAGILVKPKDDLALSRAIKTALIDKNIYNKLVSNCKKQLKIFDRRKNLEKLYAVLENERKKIL